MKTGIFAAVLAAALTFIMPTPAAANDPAPIGLIAACELGAPVAYLDLRTFVDIDLDTAGFDDVFVEITQVLSVSRAMGFTLLDKDLSGILDRGSLDEARAFLKTGMFPRWAIELRLRVNQTMAAGGQNVRDAAQAALDADAVDAYLSFLNTYQHVARDKDYRALAEGAQSSGGPEVKKAATVALAGKFEDVRVFLCSGWKAAHELDLAATPTPTVTPTPTPSASGTPAAAALPTTGSATTSVALAGLVLVAAGAGAIVLARRRRA